MTPIDVMARVADPGAPLATALQKGTYVTPVLKVYGSLTDLTRRVSKSGHPDGGVLNGTRTGGSCSGNTSGDCQG